MEPTLIGSETAVQKIINTRRAKTVERYPKEGPTYE